MELFKVDYCSYDEANETFEFIELGIFSSQAFAYYEGNRFLEGSETTRDGDTITITSFILDEVGSDEIVDEITAEM